MNKLTTTKHGKVYIMLRTYPSPESSGTYLPQPNTGGNESASEYNQVVETIFKDILKELTFPSMPHTGKNAAIRQIDKMVSVIIETNPKQQKGQTFSHVLHLT